MMKDKTFITSLIIIGLLLLSFSFIFYATGSSIPAKPDIYIINNSKDYETYDFKDLGIYYTPESLTSFDMPFIVKKSTKSGVATISKTDLTNTISSNSKNLSTLNSRTPIYSYDIIAENTNYYVINYHMSIKASDKPFSIDFVPKIGTYSYPEFAWWNSSWSYYKVLTISNKILGYQMLLNVGNVTGGNVTCNSHLKQGIYFQDIRFVNIANTTEYYHWMENCTVDTYAKFWVNNSDNASQILMYYSNPSCLNTTYRNGTNTFLFFDDFSGSSIDTTKWCGDTTSTSITNGVMLLYSASINPAISSINKFSNCTIRTYSKTNYYTSNGFEFGFGSGCPTGTTYRLVEIMEAGYDVTYNFDGIVGHVIVTNWIDNAWNIKQFFLIKDISCAWFQNDIQLTGSPYYNDVVSDDVYVRAKCVKTAKQYFDWMFVALIDIITPSWSFGAEVTKPANNIPYASNFSIVNNSANNIICLDFNCYINDTETELIYYTIQCNNGIVISGSAFDSIIYLNFSNCLFLGWNYTIWINVTDDNVNYRRYYLEFRTVECCIGSGNNMEINIENTQLFMLLLLSIWLFFVAIYLKYRQTDNVVMLGFSQWLISIPLCINIAILSNTFTFGYALLIVILILPLFLLIDALLYAEKEKNKRR